MPDSDVRRAVAGDEATVTALTAVAYAPYVAVLGGPPLPVTEVYGPSIERGEVWLLHIRGEPAGVLVLEAHPDHALIYSVAVAPVHQGRGHGLRLLRLAEELARATGLVEIRLYTNARMERNLMLYAACGYRETGRRPHPARPGWVLVDMSKHSAAG